MKARAYFCTAKQAMFSLNQYVTPSIWIIGLGQNDSTFTFSRSRRYGSQPSQNFIIPSRTNYLLRTISLHCPQYYRNSKKVVCKKRSFKIDHIKIIFRGRSIR
jgi:hypothetical protein